MTKAFQQILAMIVPAVVLKRLVLVLDPTAGDEPEMAGTPDSWRPPAWIPREQLGPQHPCRTKPVD